MLQTYDDKKRMAEQNLRDAASQKIEETTPPALTDAIKAFAAKLGSEVPNYVPVTNDQYGLFGWCSDGVLEKIKHDGGSIRFGWTIWAWPPVLLTGEFHAVWLSSAGDMTDITPKPNGEARILFVPDASYPADFDFDKRPPNKRQRLYEPPDPAAEIAAHVADMKPAQLTYEQKRAAKLGLSLEESIRRKRPPDEFAAMIDRFLQVCDDVDRELDAIPGTGYVTATPTLQSAYKEKMHLLQQIKQHAGKVSPPARP